MRQILTHAPQLRQILTARRRAAKLSQSAVASKLAISQNRLSEIELDPGSLSVERLLDLCNLLGLELVIQDKASARTAAKAEW
jgi:HTH-type transcriptional regulator/antitoxin HipB